MLQSIQLRRCCMQTESHLCHEVLHKGLVLVAELHLAARLLGLLGVESFDLLLGAELASRLDVERCERSPGCADGQPTLLLVTA